MMRKQTSDSDDDDIPDLIYDTSDSEDDEPKDSEKAMLQLLVVTYLKALSTKHHPRRKFLHGLYSNQVLPSSCT